MTIQAISNRLIVEPVVRDPRNSPDEKPIAFPARVISVGPEVAGFEEGDLVHVDPEAGFWVDAAGFYLLTIEDFEVVAIEADE